MTDEPLDARWPKLLSLAVHEFRTPITVAAGYLRMVLKERVGPISDQQRKLLEEAEKSCGRLSALVAEMSDLSALEAGTAGFNAAPLDLRHVLRECIDALPELPDRTVTVELVEDGQDGARVKADATRLRTALTSLLVAVRREVVTSDKLLARVTATDNGMYRLAIAEAEQQDALSSADAGSLERFDEWRGGSGLSLAIARRVIAQHGGQLLSPGTATKAAAVVLLPRA